MTRRILLIEFLLADHKAWLEASASMRAEATAMLMAAADDFRALGDTEPTLLLSPASETALRAADRLPGGVRVEATAAGPAAWLHENAGIAPEFAAVMVIAPECDHVLVELLRLIQSEPWDCVACLNLDSQTAAIFSDKWSTATWLKAHGIATPETTIVSDSRAQELLKGGAGNTTLSVLKPRYGAGSDRVQIISLSSSRGPEVLPPCDSGCDPNAEWVLQPMIPGIACSIGLIGGGSHQSACILPAARQNIRLSDRRFRYMGGTMPCETRLACALKSVAERVAAALGGFSGYLGLDIVVDDEGQASKDDASPVAHVIEINPRLCTSYVGYRALCASNLAGTLWQLPQSNVLHWKDRSLTFDTRGDIRESGTQAEQSDGRSLHESR